MWLRKKVSLTERASRKLLRPQNGEIRRSANTGRLTLLRLLWGMFVCLNFEQGSMEYTVETQKSEGLLVSAFYRMR
jgi:hypothetical protein